jgi:hypothetical protein
MSRIVLTDELEDLGLPKGTEVAIMNTDEYGWNMVTNGSETFWLKDEHLGFSEDFHVEESTNVLP